MSAPSPGRAHHHGSPAPGQPAAVRRLPRSPPRGPAPQAAASCAGSHPAAAPSRRGRPPGNPHPDAPRPLPARRGWSRSGRERCRRPGHGSLRPVVPRSSLAARIRPTTAPGGFVVELAGRLVGQQQARPVGQRDREGEALLLAAGDQARGPPGGRAQPHRVQQAQGPAPFDRPGWRVGPCANSTLPRAVSLCSRLRPGFWSTTPRPAAACPRRTGRSGRRRAARTPGPRRPSAVTGRPAATAAWTSRPPTGRARDLSPSATARSTPRSAVISSPGSPYTWTRPSQRTMTPPWPSRSPPGSGRPRHPRSCSCRSLPQLVQADAADQQQAGRARGSSQQYDRQPEQHDQRCRAGT